VSTASVNGIASGQTLLELHGVSKAYRGRGRHLVTALDGVSLRVPRGRITALVGESGSGKSTAIRCVLGLEKPDSGWIEYKGERLSTGTGGLGRARHREIQVVFQDPTASLNPRMSAADLIGEGLIVHGLATGKAARAARVAELMRRVGLDPDSGGPASGLLRWTAAAHRHRPRARRRTRAARLRRGRLGARRLGPGADPEPAPRHA
jgi:ABC-type glutathione transport system ATPase component